MQNYLDMLGLVIEQRPFQDISVCHRYRTYSILPRSLEAVSNYSNFISGEGNKEFGFTGRRVTVSAPTPYICHRGSISSC